MLRLVRVTPREALHRKTLKIIELRARLAELERALERASGLRELFCLVENAISSRVLVSPAFGILVAKDEAAQRYQAAAKEIRATFDAIDRALRGGKEDGE